jgi:uncharacterized protein (DUF4415 family)
MTENKRHTASNWEDKDDVIPDMTSPYWAEKFAKVPVSRGRPKLVSPKVSTTIRFDADILARFRAGGAGWQARINEALRQWLDEHSAEA